MPQQVLAGDVFIVPNGTIIAEIIAFLIILWVLKRYVVPPLQKAMEERTDLIEGGIQRAEQAQAEAQATLERYRAQLADARAEATRMREDAREQGQAIIEELRTQAQQEAARITARAEAQIGLERTQAVAELRREIGELAVSLAGRIVGESLEDEARRRRTVDRFLAELESEPTSAGAGHGAGGSDAPDRPDGRALAGSAPTAAPAESAPDRA